MHRLCNLHFLEQTSLHRVVCPVYESTPFQVFFMVYVLSNKEQYYILEFLCLPFFVCWYSLPPKTCFKHHYYSLTECEIGNIYPWAVDNYFHKNYTGFLDVVIKLDFTTLILSMINFSVLSDIIDFICKTLLYKFTPTEY